MPSCLYYSRNFQKGQQIAKKFSFSIAPNVLAFSSMIISVNRHQNHRKGIESMEQPIKSVTLKHRADWLWEWVKLRGYNFDSNDHRNTFLYIYFLTWMQAYDNYYHAYAMTHRRNRQLDKPLKPTDLDKKIKVWNQPKYDRKFTNETLIRLLEITPEEVVTLKIGYNKKLKEERAQRTVLRNERNREISLLRAKGLTYNAIAQKLNISPSTVKRILRKARSFLEGSLFTINRSVTVESAQTKFVSPEAESLYAIYKQESENASHDEYALALAKLKNSHKNIFIQGSAGTGKSYLINQFLESLSAEERKTVLLLAPTGKAADLIGGATIHKAFELPSCVQMPDEEITDVPKLLHNIKTVIIDEISMVRIDVFEMIMQILDFAATKGQNIRLIVVGDFGQLAPVCTSSDKAVLKTLYPDIKGYYAFNSAKWHKANFEKIVLHKVFRQKDAELIEHLNGIKYGRYSDLEWFKYNASPFMSNKPIYICSRRKTVDDFNNSAIEEYSKDHPTTTYQAECDGPLVSEPPCPKTLTLGVGVRVMTICNEKHYKNGMLGTVKNLDNDKVVIKFDNGKTATVKRKTFELEDGTTYIQFPLILAYAITVHRAQGSTFEHVALICDGCFEAGQLYCLLSRCSNLENMIFIGQLEPKDLKVDIEALKMTLCDK